MQNKVQNCHPERTVYEDEIDQVTLPTQEGEITVLPDHIPLISVLAAGELVAKNGSEEIAMAVSGGMIEVRKNEITILADTAERAEEIDIKTRRRSAESGPKNLKKKKSASMKPNTRLPRRFLRKISHGSKWQESI